MTERKIKVRESDILAIFISQFIESDETFQSLICWIPNTFLRSYVTKPSNRPMSSFIMVDEQGMNSKKDFDYWIDLALEFNKKAKASKKKK